MEDTNQEQKQAPLGVEHTIRAELAARNETAPSENGMMYMGVLLMIAGIIAAIVAFGYDVSVETEYNPLAAVPSRVANIDKISFREMILLCGGFSFVAGAILYAGGRIRSVLTVLAPERSRIDAAPTQT